MEANLILLVVDDFGVKYAGQEHIEHVSSVLRRHYKISDDKHGKKYCGLTLDWDYEGRKVHFSMHDYVEKALNPFKHTMPKRLQSQPHQHVLPDDGAKIQYTKPKD